jgi:hypothetical protein
MWFCRQTVLYLENVDNKFVWNVAMSLLEDNSYNILCISVQYVASHHVMPVICSENPDHSATSGHSSSLGSYGNASV